MATRGTSTRAKAAPVEEPEEDEFEEMDESEEDEDLEELEEAGEDEAEETPAPKGKKATGTKAAPKKDSIQFGSPWLAQYVTEVTGETLDSRAVRMLLRKLAKDGKLEREVGVTRDRYQFTGPNDPTVKLVLAMVKSGEAKAMKQAGLAAVKEKAEQKKAAAKAAKAAEVEEAEEVDEDEEVEEAPKPRRTRAAAPKPGPAKAAPAKATTSRRRASASA